MQFIPTFLVMSLVCAGVGTLGLASAADSVGIAGAFIGGGLFAIADAIKARATNAK